MASFSPTGILARFIAALVLVMATYNPSGVSFFHWLTQTIEANSWSPFIVLVGLVLIIGWTVFIRATKRSLGLIGFILAVAFFGTLLWLVIDVGIVPASSTRVIAYLVEVLAAAILAVGMSWSHIRRRMSGQTDVDDISDD
ncbi:MAG: DUF6524 family protein [Candidatus Eisenbacteria bacterium]